MQSSICTSRSCSSGTLTTLAGDEVSRICVLDVGRGGDKYVLQPPSHAVDPP